MPPEPHGANEEKEIKGHREIIIEQCIYKCKVSPGGTFSLGNFLFVERENYQI